MQVTVPEFRAAKAKGAKLAVVTAYDYTSARLCDEAGVDAILVGDSVGMVVQGHPNSLSVTLGEMIYHTKCVMRGARRALVVADLPFLTYQVSAKQAVRSAGRLMKEAGAHAVKLEGGVRMRAAIRACVDAGIPVILTDRAVDSTDTSLYESFIGSDFKVEGQKAGEWLAKEYAGKTGDVNIVDLDQLTPGDGKRLSVDLAAGKYVLICNVIGHYNSGQFAAFAVQ